MSTSFDDNDVTLPPTPAERLAPRPAPRAPRRRPALRWIVPLAAVLVALVAVLEAAVEPVASAAVAEVPQAAATSGIWYCPVTAEPGQSATLSIAATGDQQSSVAVVRHTSEGVVAGSTENIPAGEQRDIVLEGPEALQPVSVRWSGGPSIVTWRAEGETAAAAACASGPSPVWYLTGLDTANGSRSTLHLFNPFAVDAVARITFKTPEGPRELVTTDSELIPAGTSRRIDIATDLQLPEVADLGVVVEVRSGRLVAQGEVSYAPVAGATGPQGRSLVPAAEEPADLWAFGFAQSDDLSSSWLTIMNPGEREAAVEIQVSDPLEESELLDEVSVPAGGTYRVDLRNSSATPAFGVEVLAVNDVPVVATRTTSLVTEDGRRGIAASLGAAPSEAWSVAGAGNSGRSAFVDIYNPGPSPVTARMTAGPGTPPDWGAISVGVNQRVTLDLVGVGDERAAVGAVVAADGPVVVELRSSHEADALRPWTEVGLPQERYAGSPTRPAVRRDPSLCTVPFNQRSEDEEGE